VIVAAASLPSRPVTVVDDDEADREDLLDNLRDSEVSSVPIVGRYGQDIERLIADIQATRPSFVICDHKLQTTDFANFQGSEVVRRLIRRGQPAMLITMYKSTDRLTLRSVRHELPVVIGRDEFSPARIEFYRETCASEIADSPVPERRPHRVLIRVDEVTESYGRKRIVAVVPSWSADHALVLPEACVDQSVLPLVDQGIYLLGDVNIGAQIEDDLFFVNVNEVVRPDDAVLR
jgi:CheY-like chemotaxis protein